jgi:hypothetical protein
MTKQANIIIRHKISQWHEPNIYIEHKELDLTKQQSP